MQQHPEPSALIADPISGSIGLRSSVCEISLIDDSAGSHLDAVSAQK